MANVLSIAVMGALGSLARYGIGLLAHRLWGSHSAAGTFIVNIVGCFLLGLVMSVAHNSDAIPESFRPAITVGFLGALTTFSTFSFETFRFVEAGDWKLALLNVLANLIVGFAAVWVGYSVAGRPPA